MKCMLNTVFFGVSLTSVLFGAHAAIAANANVPNDRTIVQLTTYTSHGVIKYSPAFSNNLGCTGAQQDQWAVIDWSTNSNAKFLYAAALSAHVTKEPLGLGIRDCNSKFGGGTGVPEVYRIDLPVESGS